MKIEYFLDNLRQYNYPELEKISNSNQYQKNARIAATQIIKERKSFQNKVSSISDAQLISLLNNDNKTLSKIDFDLFIDEFKRRNIPAKIWSYKNKKTIAGPFTTDELKSMIGKEIKYHDTYVKRKDQVQWYPTNSIQGLFKNDYIPEEQGNQLKIAGILIFVSSAMWFIISFMQFSIAGAAANAIFNFIGAIWWLSVGLGVLKRKEWAYKAGYISALITAIYNFIVAVSIDFNLISYILPLVELSVFYFLIRGKKNIIAKQNVDLGLS